MYSLRKKIDNMNSARKNKEAVIAWIEENKMKEVAIQLCEVPIELIFAY